MLEKGELVTDHVDGKKKEMYASWIVALCEDEPGNAVSLLPTKLCPVTPLSHTLVNLKTRQNE